MAEPVRSEVWLVDLGLVAKVRPVLVVSIAPTVQDRALVTICPHTTSVRGTRFEVDLPLVWLAPGSFDVQNLTSIPLAKFIRKLGRVNAAEMQLVETAMKHWLGVT